MFKTASIASAAVLAVAGFAAPAMAQSISPAGTSFVLSGALILEQSTTIECNVSLNGTVAADGSSATITGASSILGSCNGVITTNWDNGTSSVSFPGSTIPGSPNSCKITGTLTSSPGLTIS
ncbi:protein activator of alkane oxidation PraB [Brevundimonas sp. 3P9-tot-E]|uniref:protein activator of alkane oxidation PraB n=1 Tax=unclassified Brevundimonas TaxID=2622653 RepID=UPI0039A0B034